ncbi:MAG: hypothetical protein M1504_00060 [Candidatus Marsarchaeota archaeon]|nr:hypothetical protein [Candidatus Marsarchaeota archaeon]
MESRTSNEPSQQPKSDGLKRYLDLIENCKNNFKPELALAAFHRIDGQVAEDKGLTEGDRRIIADKLVFCTSMLRKRIENQS